MSDKNIHCCVCGDSPLPGSDWAGSGDCWPGESEPVYGGLGACGDMHQWFRPKTVDDQIGRSLREMYHPLGDGVSIEKTKELDHSLMGEFGKGIKEITGELFVEIGGRIYFKA